MSMQEPMGTEPKQNNSSVQVQTASWSFEEAGNIGEEQLPSSAGAGPKTDKHVWNYSANGLVYVSALGQWFYRIFKGQ